MACQGVAHQWGSHFSGGTSVGRFDSLVHARRSVRGKWVKPVLRLNDGQFRDVHMHLIYISWIVFPLKCQGKRDKEKRTLAFAWTPEDQSNRKLTSYTPDQRPQETRNESLISYSDWSVTFVDTNQYTDRNCNPSQVSCVGLVRISWRDRPSLDNHLSHQRSE